MPAVYSDHRIGTLFAAAHPDLDLGRDCDTCRLIVARMDAAGLNADVERFARDIICNANRTALRQFGRDRQSQRGAIAAALRDLIAEKS